MLTIAEAQRIAAEHMALIAKLNEDESIPDEAMNPALCLHLGLSPQIYGAIVDETLEYFLEMPAALVLILNPALVAATGSALSIGIMLGKELERLTHD